MGLEYVVRKKVLNFDESKAEKYVAKPVSSGRTDFNETCTKVSQICGVHRKVVDLVISGLVDVLYYEIKDGKTVQLGEFGLFRPTLRTKSADEADKVTANNILAKRIIFKPGEIFREMLQKMSVTRAVPSDTQTDDKGGEGGKEEGDDPVIS